MADVTLEALMEEGRTFPPAPEFVANALVSDSSRGVLGRSGPNPPRLGSGLHHHL
jgi:hypothetical protein